MNSLIILALVGAAVAYPHPQYYGYPGYGYGGYGGYGSQMGAMGANNMNAYGYVRF